MPQTIILAGCPYYPPERIAAAAITPGHLVEINSGNLRKHATADGNAAPWWACETLVPSISNSQTAAINIDYATNDSVRWAQTKQGEEVYAWVPASAAAIVTGDELVSNGDGTLKKYVAQATNEAGTGTYTIRTRSVVARAAESVDNSGGGTPARIRVWSV